MKHAKANPIPKIALNAIFFQQEWEMGWEYISSLDEAQLQNFLNEVLTEATSSNLMFFDYTGLIEIIQQNKSLGFIEQLMAVTKKTNPMTSAEDVKRFTKYTDHLLSAGFAHSDPAVFSFLFDEIAKINPPTANIWHVLNAYQQPNSDKLKSSAPAIEKLEDWLSLFEPAVLNPIHIDNNLNPTPILFNSPRHEKICRKLFTPPYADFCKSWVNVSTPPGNPEHNNALTFILGFAYKTAHVVSKYPEARLDFCALIQKQAFVFDGKSPAWLYSAMFDDLSAHSSEATQAELLSQCDSIYLHQSHTKPYWKNKIFPFAAVWKNMLDTEFMLKANGLHTLLDEHFLIERTYATHPKYAANRDTKSNRGIDYKPAPVHLVEHYFKITEEHYQKILVEAERNKKPYHEPILNWLLSHPNIKQSYVDFFIKAGENQYNEVVDFFKIGDRHLSSDSTADIENIDQNNAARRRRIFALWEANPEILLSYRDHHQNNILHLMFRQPVFLYNQNVQKLVFDMIHAKPELLKKINKNGNNPISILEVKGDYDSDYDEAWAIKGACQELLKKLLPLYLKIDKDEFQKQNKITPVSTKTSKPRI